MSHRHDAVHLMEHRKMVLYGVCIVKKKSQYSMRLKERQLHSCRPGQGRQSGVLELLIGSVFAGYFHSISVKGRLHLCRNAVYSLPPSLPAAADDEVKGRWSVSWNFVHQFIYSFENVALALATKVSVIIVSTVVVWRQWSVSLSSLRKSVYLLMWLLSPWKVPSISYRSLSIHKRRYWNSLLTYNHPAKPTDFAGLFRPSSSHKPISEIQDTVAIHTIWDLEWDNGYRHRRCEHQPKLETRYSGFYYDDDYLLPALSSRTELAPHGHPGHNSALSTVIFSSGMSQSIKTAGNFPSVSHVFVFMLNFGHHTSLSTFFTACEDFPVNHCIRRSNFKRMRVYHSRFNQIAVKYAHVDFNLIHHPLTILDSYSTLSSSIRSTRRHNMVQDATLRRSANRMTSLRASYMIGPAERSRDTGVFISVYSTDTGGVLFEYGNQRSHSSATLPIPPAGWSFFGCTSKDRRWGMMRHCITACTPIHNTADNVRPRKLFTDSYGRQPFIREIRKRNEEIGRPCTRLSYLYRVGAIVTQFPRFVIPHWMKSYLFLQDKCSAGLVRPLVLTSKSHNVLVG
ncbi:uncharacterized protein BT62DRAFT_1014082 [Guyanagaster necrorhizus]|uniref:Uncharacterized protein n=1 Tax=Guyanagaster necrorhizus TaxID=856835 RepID=A0A9P8ALZ2_9AGAR|nr:uncharacterized protein BT62DRAFT_1014082 [Guyanagaster necrorhizus MCA 3950]KAG7439342.1 hypothetical protein BT62DRAFT_1014082 [Guyanagaster necrorhizus MCA 3950]